MKMDEEYIGIFIKQEAHCLTYYISMKTLQVESSTTIDKFDEIIYEKGYLIVYRKKKIGWDNLFLFVQLKFLLFK